MKFFSTFISVGILMIFGTILGIQLEGKSDSYSQVNAVGVSNFAEPESTENSDAQSIAETEDVESVDFHTEKSVLSKLGQGLNHALSGVSEKAVSGLE